MIDSYQPVGVTLPLMNMLLGEVGPLMELMQS
jgi:hypothetical protein